MYVLVPNNNGWFHGDFLPQHKFKSTYPLCPNNTLYPEAVLNYYKTLQTQNDYIEDTEDEDEGERNDMYWKFHEALEPKVSALLNILGRDLEIKWNWEGDAF